MIRLAITLYGIIGPSLAGAGVIAVLVAGYGTLSPILAAAAVGFAAGVPASVVVARRLTG